MLFLAKLKEAGMEPVKWLTSALGATAAAQTAQAQAQGARAEPKVQAPFQAPERPFDFAQWLEMMPAANPGVMAPFQAPHIHERAAGQTLTTRYSKCVDVKDGRFVNGGQVQLWDCDSGNKNQMWTYAGGQLQNNGFCLDVKDSTYHYGAPLQIWQCIKGNRNQMWTKSSVGFQVTGTSYSLDVKDGHYDNGAQLQLWGSDNNANGNQVFKLGEAAQTTTQSPSSFLGYATISWERFASLHPECAPYGDAFQAAAAANNLVPTLLGAVAETESSCNARVNRWGLMQFSDDGAWNQFGGSDKDRMNPTDAAWAGARYLRFLINQNNQNLDAALRDYNGPLSQGGNPNYQNEIRQWMSGGNPWG